MHVELAELLRCPERHPESPLVLAADRTESRVVLEGTLGCPLCGAEYGIRDGVTYFSPHSGDANRAANRTAHPTQIGSAPEVDDAADGPDEAMRLAALLGVSEPSGTVALISAGVPVALALQALVPMRCLVVDPPAALHPERVVPGRAPLAILQCDGFLPVPDRSLDGILVQQAGAHYLAAAVAALKPKGRLVASADVTVPAGIIELARDGRHWVGERGPDAGADAGPVPLVQLRRRR